jgi:hypothetical protein
MSNQFFRSNYEINVVKNDLTRALNSKTTDSLFYLVLPFQNYPTMDGSRLLSLAAQLTAGQPSAL